jgi:hypothetical protein
MPTVGIHPTLLAKPLTILTTKSAMSSMFALPTPAVAAFDALKQAFSSTLTLRHFRPDLPTVLETDSSGFAAAILS